MISPKASSICAGFALLTIGISATLPLQPAAAADPAQPVMGDQHRALLKENCLSCHNETKKKGGIRLDDLPFAVNNGQAAERWQQVLDQMNSGDMPPEDEKQPEKSAKANFLDDLAHVMVAARRTLQTSRARSPCAG
ncbi:c-type cytochrome domain-containing protein [Verrucomicrobium spinosum]|uniref:c-type cytochrome domain-containing protein n=1 Tax=Verrucomicrobium spinosum TaxID=2736 RepID=UPI000A763455|nr:c-type cytochrome domain-containing protein [Verrucomicrobium spinosum]